MKWYMHETEEKDSEELRALIHEFGFEGYGRWTRIKDIVAERMDGSDRCHYEQDEWEWCCNLKAKRKQLSCFLKAIEKLGLCNLVASGKQLRIEIPKLLNLRGEYSKKFKKTPKKIAKTPSIREVKDKDKDIKKIMRQAAPASSGFKHTDTYKAEQKWIDLYKKEYGRKPEMSPAKDRTILKQLIENHGFDLVMKKIGMHIYEDKLLTIGGFKIMFNDLNDEPFDPEEVVI